MRGQGYLCRTHCLACFRVVRLVCNRDAHRFCQKGSVSRWIPFRQKPLSMPALEIRLRNKTSIALACACASGKRKAMLSLIESMAFMFQIKNIDEGGRSSLSIIRSKIALCTLPLKARVQLKLPKCCQLTKNACKMQDSWQVCTYDTRYLGKIRLCSLYSVI